MRVIFLSSFFFVCLAFYAQKKTITITESVLKQRALSPQRTLGFSWIKNLSEYSLLSSDYKSIIAYNLTQEGERVVCNVDEINAKLSSENQILNLYGYEWLTSDELLMNTGNVIFTFNVKTKQLVLKQSDLGDYENVNFHPRSGNCAYTLGNNLYLNGKAVTKNEDKNIVSGQSIARNEFGIDKGIFWSENANY